MYNICMGNSQTIVILTKEQVEYIKNRVFPYCCWADKIMQKFEDLFNHLDFTEDNVLELRGTLLSMKHPKQEQIYIQRLKNL